MPDKFSIDLLDEINEPLKIITNADKTLADAINESMSDFASKEIEQNITSILPNSGREWKGKAAHASESEPFRHELINLGTIVRTKTEYNYLYFPNDGSNTVSHQGNQQFMIHGAEMSQDAIIEDIQKRFYES